MTRSIDYVPDERKPVTLSGNDRADSTGKLEKRKYLCHRMLACIRRGSKYLYAERKHGYIDRYFEYG